MSAYRITAKSTMADVRDAQARGDYLEWRTAEYKYELYESPDPDLGKLGGVVVYSFGPSGRVSWSGSTSFHEWSDRAIDVMRDAREVRSYA